MAILHSRRKPRLGARINRAHPLSRDLDAWWLFNERGGAKLWDLTSGKHGTLTNMDPSSDWISTPKGGGLSFDGTNDHVNLGNVLAYERTQAFSISVWLRTTVTSPTTGLHIISKAGTPRGWSLAISGTDANDPWMFTLATTAPNQLIVQYPRPDDTLWHHIVVTYTGNSLANGVTFYQDGLPLTQSIIDNDLNGTIVDTAIDLMIGCKSTGTLFYPGEIDDIRVWKRVLTISEVKELYRNPYVNIITTSTAKSRFIAAAGGTTTYHYLASMGVGPVTR